MLLFCCAMLHVVCNAQKTDTLTIVELRSKKPLDPALTTVPVQQLDKKTLQQLNSFSVADAVKYFSGTIVKDYGGIGGLKTVSVRSLGANHTGVMYNGIMVADAQGGQIDLGAYSLDNIEEVQLYNSAPVNILQTARAFSYSAVLSIKSSSGVFDPGRPASFTAQFKAGTVGLINPSVSFRSAGSKHFQNGFSAEYLKAEGNYTFRSYEDRTKTASRNNSDIRSGRLEYNAAFIKNDSNKIQLNAYYYNSHRGLPGAIIFFNPASSERLNDENFFTQLSWQNYLSKKWRMLISAKFSKDKRYYLDPSYPNFAGKLENDFHQQGKYISAAFSYKIIPDLNISAATDLFNDQLKRTDQFAAGFAQPARNTFLSNAAIQWKKKYTEISGNVLYTSLHEKLRNGKAGRNIDAFSPSVSASVQPFQHIPLRLRFFYKNIFRAPTFNDLYYTNIGNANLRPEYAAQYNAGITYNEKPAGLVKEFVATADAYYNAVTDQILAVPRQNLAQWTMLNIGRVKIKGIDAGFHFALKEFRGINISSRIAYTFRQALDVSDPSSPFYKKQTAYTPQHSGSINFNIAYKKATFSYNIISSAYRYRLGDQIPENVVQGWSQHDVSIQYIIISNEAIRCNMLAAFDNIYNTQYEIIKYYPMPRFQCRIGVTANFKYQYK